MECELDDASASASTSRYLAAAAHVVQPQSKEQFLSWISIVICIVMFLFFRSIAGPFLTGENRKAVSSFYFNLMALVYLWLVSSSALTILPHFFGSGESNAAAAIISAAAVFFPMLFASIAATMAGRLIVRMIYYATTTTRMVEKAGIEAWKSTSSLAYQQHSQQQRQQVNSGNNASEKPEGSPTVAFRDSIHSKLPQLNLVAFQRPFRKLVKGSAFVSGALCFLYAHCWSSNLSAFKVDRADGAGAICRAVFSPLAFGGLSTVRGAEEMTIWYVWATCIVAIVISYAQDEFAGKHCINGDDGPADESPLDQNITERANGTASNESPLGSARSNAMRKTFPFIGSSSEGPQDVLPMVPWYSVVLIYSVFDLLVAFKVFLGRYDARTMQPALQSAARSYVSDKGGEEERGTEQRHEDKIGKLKRSYAGSVFDMSSAESHWFDFVADVGDGFDSSYQVARMLAQPSLTCNVIQDEKLRVRQLPRGEFLVIGGDLAYPDPTEEAYETRFFRPFQDAMQPPPSFRPRAISTKKPALPVEGWRSCFHSSGKESDRMRTSTDLKQYKGPCAFAIPGNHDWYDGLVTYSRFIIGRDWLGGWLMPQERSYFALKLQKGWWLLAADLGLSADVDLEQFKFFADVASSMDESDAVIIVTHEPHWVLDSEYNADQLAEENLRELMDTHLKGKVRLRLAGDLHHYTRHSPVFSSSPPLPKTSIRSISLTDRGHCYDATRSVATNDPELIVSGGGGAFLHGTHTFRKYVNVGESQQKYKRVCCYPDEKTSTRLGWINMLHFRFRNWRLDIIWAIAAFGISSSLFPLCGIYKNYLEHAHDQGPFTLLFWLVRTLWALFCQIFRTGRVSLFFTLAVSWALFALTDTKPKPKVRLLLGLGHAAAHVIVSLSCLVLIQCLVEWIVADGIVTVASQSSKTSAVAVDHIHGQGTKDLASCLYDEFNEHWSQVLANFTGNLTQSDSNSTMNIASALPDGEDFSQMSAVERMHSYAFEAGKDVLAWLLNMSLLSSTLYFFDLPGLIATKHYGMCEILCAGDGVECMISSDPTKFLLVDRMTLTVYLLGTFLYFAIMAVPTAGNVFGTWLALMLNVFKTQYNEGFSSLRIPHWKNFCKIHIDDNGDLEVYALGLHRVPRRWVRDADWRGERNNLDGTPSWSVDKPSKWVPLHKSKKFTPQVVDYIRIPKRSIGRNTTIGVSTPSRSRDRSRKMDTKNRRGTSF